MPYEFTAEGHQKLDEVQSFMDDHIYPNEEEYAAEREEVGPHGYPPIMDKPNPNAPRHLQQSMIVVPKETAGISFGRAPHVFGYDHHGGHPEVIYENVRVPADNLLGEDGGGFAISQARLGPGRIHHCMR